MTYVIIFLFAMYILYSAIIIYKKPEILLSYVISLFAVEQFLQSKIVFLLRYPFLYNFFILGMSLVCLVKVLFAKNFKFNFGIVHTLVLLLYLYSFLTLFWVDNLEQSLSLWKFHAPYLILYFVFIPLLVTNISSLYNSLNFYYYFGIVLCLLLLFFVNWEYRFIVFSGSYLLDSYGAVKGNPLAIAQFAGTLCIVCLFIPSNGKISLLARYVVFGFAIFLLIKSGSRGQLLGMFFSVILFMPYAYEVFKIKSFFCILVLFMSIFIFSYFAFKHLWLENNVTDSARWTIESMDSAMSGRFESAFTLLRHWFSEINYVIFGLGNSISYSKDVIGIYPHFVPLEILGEEGLIGFSIYLVIVFLALCNIFKFYKLSLWNDCHQKTIACFSSIMLYYFILSLKEGSLLGNSISFMIFIIYEKILKNYENNKSTFGVSH